MELAADLEDRTEKSVVTPGPLSPARELLGEMLLEMNDPTKALEQFEETLKKEPRRFRSLYGAAHAAHLIGRADMSQLYFRELLEIVLTLTSLEDPNSRKRARRWRKQKS